MDRKTQNKQQRGGVGILVSEKIARNTTEDNSGDEHERLETKWIKLDCRPRSIAIGIFFYSPEENEKGEKVKEVYAALNRQIEQKHTECDIILAGDFNTKLKIDKENCKQGESRNGKILSELITQNNLYPANIYGDHGIWTRVNHKISTERSVIDYILVSPRIKRGVATMIVDEEGHLRIKGENETDHNTILMTIKVNDARKPTYRTMWNLENKDGWKEFNNMIAENKNKQQITQGWYEEAEKRITNLLKQTIGKKVRTDKVKRVTNEEIKALRKKKRQKGNSKQHAN